MSGISYTELCKIINRTLSMYEDDSVTVFDTEVKIFKNKYLTRKKENPQIGIFEERLPTLENINKAIIFFENLERYRKITDVHLEKQETESEAFYRSLYNTLQEYMEFLTPKNKKIADILTRSMKTYLPEYHDEILLEDLNKEILQIKALRNMSTRQKKKGQTGSKDYEVRAAVFFKKSFLGNPHIKKIKPCKEKMVLYQNCIKIVNCLPYRYGLEKYGRIKKFIIKRDLYKELAEIAGELGSEYEKTARTAQLEVDRYQKAIDTTINYVENPHSRRETPEQRQARLQEEYYCK